MVPMKASANAAGGLANNKSPQTGKTSLLAKGGNEPRQQDRPEPSESLDSENRYRMIAEAAYFRAAQRHFVSGRELEDWLEAEADVEGILTKSSAPTVRAQA